MAQSTAAGAIAHLPAWLAVPAHTRSLGQSRGFPTLMKFCGCTY